MNKIFKGVVIGLISICSLSGIIFFNSMDVVKSDEYVSIDNNGISIKMLSSSDNDYGEKDQVISYSISPENATEQGIIVKLSYIDESDCSSVMEYSINEKKKEITLSCKGAFEQQIILTLTSKDDVNVSASITLNYVKKVIGYTKRIVIPIFGEAYGSVSKQFVATDFVNPDYSIYTEDYDYTYKIVVNSIEAGKHMFGYDDTSPLDISFDEFNDIVEKIRPIIKRKLENGEKYFSNDELWNMSNVNEWHTLLRKIEKNDVEFGHGYLTYNTNMTIICNEIPSITFTDTFKVKCSLAGDYTSFIVPVSSILVDVSSINF